MLDSIVSVQEMGAITTIEPLTKQAEDWLLDNVDGMWLSGRLVSEPRFVSDILFAMDDAIGT